MSYNRGSPLPGSPGQDDIKKNFNIKVQRTGNKKTKQSRNENQYKKRIMDNKKQMLKECDCKDFTFFYTRLLIRYILVHYS